LHLPKGKAHRIGSVLVPQVGPFMKQQHEAKTLNDLNCRGPPTNCVACALHEIVREVTTS
jgi:broad specificity polyphosphatase/5'/3'-nucleotidase SurE